MHLPQHWCRNKTEPTWVPEVSRSRKAGAEITPRPSPPPPVTSAPTLRERASGTHGKRSLHSRWNFNSTHNEVKVHIYAVSQSRNEKLKWRTRMGEGPGATKQSCTDQHLSLLRQASRSGQQGFGTGHRFTKMWEAGAQYRNGWHRGKTQLLPCGQLDLEPMVIAHNDEFKFS